MSWQDPHVYQHPADVWLSRYIDGKGSCYSEDGTPSPNRVPVGFTQTTRASRWGEAEWTARDVDRARDIAD